MKKSEAFFYLGMHLLKRIKHGAKMFLWGILLERLPNSNAFPKFAPVSHKIKFLFLKKNYSRASFETEDCQQGSGQSRLKWILESTWIFKLFSHIPLIVYSTMANRLRKAEGHFVVMWKDLGLWSIWPKLKCEISMKRPISTINSCFSLNNAFQ